MSTLSIHFQWEDETSRERTGHPLSYAVAMKIKLLTLHTHGCLRASVKDCPYVSSFIHSGYFYSAASSPLLLGGAPEYSIQNTPAFICCGYENKIANTSYPWLPQS